MKVLVTGVKGQLGFDVLNELNRRNHKAIRVDIKEVDITDKATVTKVIKETSPEAIIHCTVWTAVLQPKMKILKKWFTWLTELEP